MPVLLGHNKKKNLIAVFLRIIARGDYFFFHTKRGRLLFEGRRLFKGGDYFKEINAHWKSCPKYFVLFSH